MNRRVVDYAILACAGLPLLNALLNRRHIRSPSCTGGTSRRVSVLIPARNEGQRITAALSHVLSSTGVALEVIVLDDASTDDTAAKVRALDDPRIRLLDGTPLPRGWAGKNHACAQLAAAARYETLLFVDADVWLKPDAITRLLGEMAHEKRPSLVSGVPRQITVTPLEWLLLPMINVLLAGYLPVARDDGTDPRFAAACGQLIMLDAHDYHAIGGHGAVRDRLHDGLALARAMRRSGYRTTIVDGTDLATCRMYETGRDVLSGLAKNATEGLAAGPGLIVWSLLLGLGHVAPFVRRGSVPIVLARIMSILMRTIVARQYRQGALTVLFSPIGVGGLLAVQWFAAFRHFLGHRVAWKGRFYETN